MFPSQVLFSDSEHLVTLFFESDSYFSVFTGEEKEEVWKLEWRWKEKGEVGVVVDQLQAEGGQRNYWSHTLTVCSCVYVFMCVCEGVSCSAQPLSAHVILTVYVYISVTASLCLYAYYRYISNITVLMCLPVRVCVCVFER